MTTPTDFAAWKAKALELADERVRLYESCRYADAAASRVALAAHLDDVPMGDPVGLYQQEPDGSISRVSSDYAKDPDVFPLYRHPKDSA